MMSLVFIPCAHVHCSVSPHVFVKELSLNTIRYNPGEHDRIGDEDGHGDTLWTDTRVPSRKRFDYRLLQESRNVLYREQHRRRQTSSSSTQQYWCEDL